LNNYRVADLVADFLLAIKVRHVFLVPGGGNMHLVDAVQKNYKIKAVPLHHEQSTVIAAEAYSRISENIGAAMVTTGPGATNAITGVAGAWVESSPIMIFSGQVKTKDIMRSNKLRQNGVQEINIVNMVKYITKFSTTLKTHKNVLNILINSYKLAISGRPGPVWIDIPLDIQSKKIKKINIYKKLYKKNILKKKLNLFRIQKLLNNSKRPVFIIGNGVRISKGYKTINKIAKKFSIPILLTWNAMDILPFNHKLNFGRPGSVALRSSNFIIQNSDLVISVGSSLDNIITGFNPKNFAAKAKKIVVNIDKEVIKNSKIKFICKFYEDANIFLNNFLELKFKQNRYKQWIKYCSKIRNKYRLEKEKNFFVKGKIRHYQLVNSLSKFIPAQKIICTGSSGLSIEQFYAFFKNKKNQRIFLTAGLGSMGFGLPSSIGSYFANNKKSLYLIEGDGSFQMNIQELAVISNYKIPIAIIIFNNNGYASIRNTQKNYFSGRYCGTGPESDLTFPSYFYMARAHKLDYLKISKLKELSKLKKKLKKIKRPIIIDVHLINNETLSPKVASILDVNGKMTSMPLEDMSPLLNINDLKKSMIYDISKNSMHARFKTKNE
jgi:acetolactate synthase-1/2/3 large subunit